MKRLTKPDTQVLIVDDSAQYATVLKRILAHVFEMKEVTVVDNPTKAEALIRENPDRFQLLFIDYHFPTGETGGELIERLSSSELLKSKVAFLITSEPSVDSVKLAQAAGVRGVIAKPFDRDQLRKQLEKAEWAQETDDGSFSVGED